MSFLVMPSMRSAAELKALTTASEAALARSAATTRASCSAVASSSRRRILRAASANSSATISAAITVSLVSPISPNFLRSSLDALVEILGKRLQMLLLPVLAGETELAAGNRWRCTWAMRSHSFDVQHRLDAGDGGVQPLRDLAVGGLQPARARGFAVERGGEPGAVDAERVELARQPLLAAVGLAPALDRGIEPVERKRQTLDRCIDRALLGHRHDPHSKTLAAANI